MIYLFAFNFMLLLRFVLAKNIRSRRQIYYILFVGLFLFSAFRFEVGCDWTGYIFQHSIYDSSFILDKNNNREILWVLLFRLQHWLDLPYPWINVFSSFIFFFGLHSMARRQPDPLSFLILLFPILIINLPMSGIRQGAAVGLLFFAFNAFVDKSAIRFTIFTLLAAALHSSALIFIFLIPLVQGLFSRERLLLATLLAIPGTFLLLQGNAAEIAMTRYLGTSTDANGAVFRVGLLGITGIYFLLSLQWNWRKLYLVDFKLAMIGSILMLTLAALLPFSSVIADRVAYYFIPMQAMILSRIPFLQLPKDRKLHIAFPYILLAATFMVWTSFSRHFELCYIPYQTWLFGFPQQIRGYF